MKLKNNKGITLIALIITIIVLLILAGVSIATLTGENGLLNKAETAKETTEQKTAEEQVKLAIMASYNTSGKIDLGELKTNLSKIEGITGVPDEITDDSFPLEVTIDGQKIELTKTGETITVVVTGGTITQDTPVESEIVKQAKAAMPTGASIKAGTTEETGIVMIDSNENEWVWVEVPSTVFSEGTTATNYDAIKADLIAYATDYRNGSSSQTYSWKDTYYSGCGISSSTKYTTLYKKMLRSIYTNKGFYISRYEIGDKESTESNTTRTSSTGVANTPVSKADQIPYNYVYCSQAQTLASNMATGDKTSSLLFGIQWDLVCKYLEVNGDWDTTTNTASYYIKTNSTSWGNHANRSLTLKSGKYLVSVSSSNTWKAYNEDTTNYVTNSVTSSDENYYQLLTTGASEQVNKMNIYDFAGNEYEWTLEYSTFSSYPCVARGGCCGQNTNYPASYRGSNEASRRTSYFSFRSSLY